MVLHLYYYVYILYFEVQIKRLRNSVGHIISQQHGSNIENVTVVDQDDRVCVDLITLTVKDRVHLAKVMRRLRANKAVLRLSRKKGG